MHFAVETPGVEILQFFVIFGGPKMGFLNFSLFCVGLVPWLLWDSGDAHRGWSAGENCLSISFPSFEKSSKKPLLKRPPRGQKNKFSEKLTKSDFWWQNRVCRGRISGIGTKNIKIGRKFQILWHLKKFKNWKIL